MLDGSFFKYAGDKFVSKQVDNKKKKKLKKVEEKMLGWGMFGFLNLVDSQFNHFFSLISLFHLVYFKFKCCVDLPSSIRFYKILLVDVN